MKELLYIIFLNISQIMSYRQNANLNLNPYYNMPYIYSSMPGMQPRIMPEPFYMNLQNSNNSLLKDQNPQNQIFINENYKNYYEEQTKNYYNSLLHQNGQIANNPFLIQGNNT
jgi:hypothetical protein